MTGISGGIEWPEGLVLAKNVIIAHADIASAGLRAALLMCRTLGTLQDVQSTSAGAKLFDFDEEGERNETAPAWTDGVGPTSSAVQVETFSDTDSKPVMTFILINAPIQLENTSTVALDIVRKLTESKVGSVTLVAAVRFNPRSSSDASLVHTAAFQSGVTKTLSTSDQLRAWDAAWSIDDGFLAAVMQLLKLEKDITVECLLAAGHRLRRPVLLNLPKAQEDDSSLPTVMHLFSALQVCAVSAAIKSVTKDQTLPTCTVSDLKGRFYPARPLTDGEFAAPEPDSASSLYK